MDTELGMYDMTTGHEIVSFVGHASTISGASLSPNSKLVATTSTDYNMIIWDAVTGKQLFVFEHSKIVVCSCFSTDSRFVVSGSQDRVCRVWDSKRGKLLRCYSGHTGIIISLTFSPTMDTVASASSDRTLKIWNATTGVDVYNLLGHSRIVLNCRYSHDGQRLVSNDEQVVRVWNTSTGQSLHQIKVEGIQAIVAPRGKSFTWTYCSFCPGSIQPLCYYVIVACSDRTVRVFQTTTSREILQIYCKTVVYCLDSGNSSRAVLGDSYGNVYTVHFE
eukprot:TRINITY_DN18932_c0_g1_i2.p1 TRINITY_DN18932_c0_g1~~TRINITY_DN18932_c0_g1_i2.p1  ORF type:complete len:276 (+),score=33.98 TRINITY_DN18932_c0_g1_i2:107-934(+)